MNNVRNKSGFSLLEIVIAMGLAAGLLVFYMKMQTEQAKNAKTAKVNQEVETFANDFKGVINRPGFCDKSFEKISLSDGGIAEITQIKNPRNDIRYEVGKTYNNNSLKLTSIMIKNFKPDDTEGFEGIATLEIGIERLGNIYGAKNIIKNFEVSVSRNQARQIVSCGSLSSGGLNVNINVPTTTAPKTEEANSQPQSQTTSQQAVTSPAPSESPAAQPSSPSSSPSQEEMMRQLQNDPQFKQMQESFKNLRDVENSIDE